MDLARRHLLAPQHPHLSALTPTATSTTVRRIDAGAVVPATAGRLSVPSPRDRRAPAATAPPPMSHVLTAARAAFEERRWADAVGSFRAAEADGAANLTARDHDQLAAAAYLAGDDDTS